MQLCWAHDTGTLAASRPQVAYSIARVRDTLPRLHQLAQGGTAVGTGLNQKVGFDEKVASQVRGMRVGRAYAPS